MRHMTPIGKKGQESALSGDIPSIIMIVLSIAFFISCIYLAMEQFDSKKASIDMEAALVEAAGVFLKNNAKITPSELQSTSDFWELSIRKIEESYGVNTYVEIQGMPFEGVNPPQCMNPDSPECHSDGEKPPESAVALSKRFPIAMKPDGATDMDIFPALIKVYVYK